jgi:transcriptional regulator with XRE-family HTH domain
MNVELIGYMIKYLREQKGWTQQQLADQLMVSRSTVTKWETNQLTPDIHNLLSLSNIFDVTLDGLVGHKSDSDKLVKEFKRIYRSNSIAFDEEAIEIVSYIMRFPQFKKNLYRLSELPLRKQQSIHHILANIINELEQI